MKSGIIEAVARATAKVGVAPFLLAVGVVVPCPQAGAVGVAGLPSLCPCRWLLGVPCPGCGMTRAFVCCCHGAVAEAFRFHPLGPIIFGGVVVAALRRFPAVRDWLAPVPEWVADGLLAVGVALTVGIWVARLTHVLPSPPG